MKRGILRITPELLVTLMRLPEDTKIHGASWDMLTRTIMLSVEHPDLPDVPDRNPACTVKPRVSWI